MPTYPDDGLLSAIRFLGGVYPIVLLLFRSLLLGERTERKKMIRKAKANAPPLLAEQPKRRADQRAKRHSRGLKEQEGKREGRECSKGTIVHSVPTTTGLAAWLFALEEKRTDWQGIPMSRTGAMHSVAAG